MVAVVGECRVVERQMGRERWQARPVQVSLTLTNQGVSMPSPRASRACSRAHTRPLSSVRDSSLARI